VIAVTVSISSTVQPKAEATSPINAVIAPIKAKDVMKHAHPPQISTNNASRVLVYIVLY
jgi:hypothetical protein